MSDLTATQCGCSRPKPEPCCNNGGGCGSILWIISLLSLCGGGNNDGCGCGGFGGLGGFGGDGCECIFIIILLLCCCGGGSFC